MSVSHWLRQDSTVLDERDWVVIGAGATGLCAGIALKAAGEDALILERDAIGRRASTRNAGYLMRGAADNYYLACEQYGRERAKELWKLTEHNLRTIREFGVESLPSYQTRPSCLLAFDEGELRELERSHALLIEDGFECDWITSGSDAVWTHGKPIAGLVNPNDGVCNPAELIAMLRNRFGGDIREQSPVGELRFQPGHIEIVVPGGVIRAGRVIICTNAYARELGSAMPAVEPNRGQMLALRVDGPMLDLSYYSDHGSEYYRQADERTVVVGGRRKSRELEERTASESPTDVLQSELESFAEKILGRRFPVIARWAGTMGFTADGLPVVSPIAGSDERAWFVGGMNGHGMSMACQTAHLAVDHMMGRGENPFPAAPEPLGKTS